MSTPTNPSANAVSDYTYVREWPCTTYAAPALSPVWPIAYLPAQALSGPARSRRERRPIAASRTTVRFAGWELDLVERRLIAPGGGTERLPGLEFALLKAFVSCARQPLTRPELANVLARDADARLSGRTVDSYVSRLRRRLRRGGSTSLISTVWTIGYRFDADVLQT